MRETIEITLLHADTINKNNLVYSIQVLENMCKKINDGKVEVIHDFEFELKHAFVKDGVLKVRVYKQGENNGSKN